MEAIRAFRILMVLFAVLLTLNSVSGQDYLDASIKISQPIKTLICNVLFEALINIAGALAAVVFVFAGVQYIVATDDPGKRKASKDLMIFAIVGILIVALAESIIDAVMKPGCRP